MIKKSELEKIAGIKSLSQESAEKDYLLDLLLFSIYSEYPDALVFKGGTALYKVYKLNRFSEDLDFTMNKKRFDVEEFSRKMAWLLKSIGVEMKIKEIIRHRNEINMRIVFKGPLYDGRKETLCFIAINISLREKVLKDPRRELIVSRYSDVPSFICAVMDEEEMLAEKVRAVMTRDKARDVYDLWFLLKRGVRPNPRFIGKKLKIYRTGFSLGKFVASIEEKRGSWEKDLKGLVIGGLPDFDRVKDDISRGFA